MPEGHSYLQCILTKYLYNSYDDICTPMLFFCQVCQIHIEAPDAGGDYGIMAHIEEMHMRRNAKTRDCVDFVQFGRDDFVPFVTFQKSRRFCGQVSPPVDRGQPWLGYDEPGGSLLVWINLGGRRSTENWPAINHVNLTLVVTAYRKRCVCAFSRKMK